jgi:hypothetical protein
MHLIFDSASGHAKLFRKDGLLYLDFPMRDAAVHGPGFGHWGRCPRGVFRLGAPVNTEDPALGDFFTPIMGTESYHRFGIGIHGGGTGCAEPFADKQGWVPTHGCLRVQNEDNRKLVLALRMHDEPHIITVQGP